MTPTELQQWLCAHGAVVTVDGDPGRETRDGIKTAFVNTCAPAVTQVEIAALATRLGCTTRQLRAVAKVESGGSAYDDNGRPKILFERHLFHKFTGGRFSPASFSQEKGGGYNESSWDKLTQAACKDVGAAFAATSWGKFQVLGMHWGKLCYPSALELAYSTVTGEGAHYELLARYIEKNGMKIALAALSTDAMHNRPFAAGYNGPSYRNFRYDEKLAEAMA